MVVEMAVVVPVILVVAIVAINLMQFVEAVSRFDRIAPDAVVALAVSPSGEDGDSRQEATVAGAILEEMGWEGRVSVDVEAQDVWDAVASGCSFGIAPHLTRYVCTLRFSPWPSGFSVAGIDAGVPFELTHRKSVVVDRFRSGVLF